MDLQNAKVKSLVSLLMIQNCMIKLKVFFNNYVMYKASSYWKRAEWRETGKFAFSLPRNAVNETVPSLAGRQVVEASSLPMAVGLV